MQVYMDGKISHSSNLVHQKTNLMQNLYWLVTCKIHENKVYFNTVSTRSSKFSKKAFMFFQAYNIKL